MDSIKYAYIGDCKAGWVSCFGHRWEVGIPYSIRVDAMVPGSIKKKRDGTMTKGVKVIYKLDGNPDFTNDMDKIGFLAAKREERILREKIMAEKRLTFQPENKAKVETILADTEVNPMDANPDANPLLTPREERETSTTTEETAEPSLDDILGYNS